MTPSVLRATKALSLPSPAANFQGAVRNHRLTDAESGVEVLSVWFPAGGRTNCHTHAVDQLLLVTEGEIAVGIGTERKLLRVGEMIVIPADVWHWHGATPYLDACHLSIKPPSGSDWGEPPAADRAEFAAYDDWELWVQGISV
jgi:quercetin dioxygenase-like cupin family protein